MRELDRVGHRRQIGVVLKVLDKDVQIGDRVGFLRQIDPCGVLEIGQLAIGECFVQRGASIGAIHITRSRTG